MWRSRPPSSPEQAGAEPGAGSARVAAIVAAGRPAVICAHRENLPLLLAAAVRGPRRGAARGDALEFAGFWVLHAADGALVAAERHHPDEP